MSVFYAHLYSTSDNHSRRVLAVFANRKVADEWWYAVLNGPPILSSNIHRISPQVYNYNGSMFQMSLFFKEPQFQSVADQFRGRMFLTGEVVKSVGSEMSLSSPIETMAISNGSAPLLYSKPLRLLSDAYIMTLPANTSPSASSTTPPAQPSPPTMFLSFANAHVSSYTEIFWHLKCLPKEPSVVLSARPALYALIIGINKYDDITNLSGCVSDADSVEEFLKNDLQVPKKHIISLRDEQASRSAIIRAFGDLADDVRIKRDDPIFIFFAGHGSELAAPSGWAVGGGDSKIQALVPQDYNSSDLNKLVHAIPDRTVGALINKISREKGNNITVIFDCCHSGSSTRGDIDSMERTVELENNTPADLDQHAWCESADHGEALAPGTLYTGLESHVLIAACGAKEVATEYGTPKRGRFTKAFIQLLRQEGVDKLRYSDVLNRLESIPNQNPQCEGKHSDRVFFDAKSPPARRVVYPVQMEHGEYRMEAGSAHGISAGAEFAVYADYNTDLTSEPLGGLVVDRIEFFHTTLKPTSGIPFLVGESAVALQTKLGQKEDLTLHVEFDIKLISVFEALLMDMQAPGPDSAKIALVGRNQAKLEIVMEGDQLYFNNLDERVTSYGISHIQYPVKPKPDVIHRILHAAAHYHWHLNRNSTLDKIFASNVDVEFFELRPDYEYEGEWTPGDNPVNLYAGGAIDLVLDVSKRYGMRLTNKINQPLYPAVFHFKEDLSIVSHYSPKTSGNPDSEFQPNQMFPIGYGFTGIPPIRHTCDLPDGQDISVGFLKMFFTTRYVDFSNIPQPTPFIPGRADIPPPKKAKRAKWGTILIPFIERRRK
ncbi:hypothetical protein FIBSPDRAFT_895063 [Athelia psychrophila]|uniref:Peptidase C14 caspase domain-containing protein n=1 Tax=Athelia psychrophila TaxID=1759441 RepID=A0A166F0Q6_9AGAM|nr:hypothetical protein FIBSPDRAFT_895063 [Fibularhizoctonia sp. CBS 109695]